MTVTNTTDQVSYTGPQPANLAYPFRIFQAADLLVTQTALDGTVSTLVLDTDYTVDGVLSYTGGDVTLLAGSLDSGVVVVISRAPEAVQDTSLQSQGAYDAKTVENGLDLLTMICQWLQNQVDRAIVVPPGTTPVALPAPLALALLQWKADLSGLQNIAISDLGAILTAGNYIVDAPAFTPGSTTALTLTQAPGTVNNLWIYFDGAYQQRSTFTVSGTTATLSSPVPFGVLRVECIQAGVLPINTPADNSVTTASIANLAVTGPKIGAEAVDLTKMAPSLLAVLPQHGRNAITDGSAMLANGADYAASVSGTFDYGKSDLCKGALVGTAVSGTLTRVANSSLGRTGRSFKWSAVTTTGAGLAKWRFFVEAADAARFKNQTASLSFAARHDAGVAIPFAISVYKADVADVFSAVTLIHAGASTSVATATNAAIAEEAISMGDCSNGILVEVVATIGAVSTKNFEITEVQLELGETATDFDFRPLSEVAARGAWFFETLGGHASDLVATGFASVAGAAMFGLVYYAKKRTNPTITAQTAASFCLLAYDGATIACNAVGGSGTARLTMGVVTFAVAAGLVGNQPYLAEATATSGLLRIDARF